MVGDPQMKDDRRLDYYKKGVIPFMATKEADFYVVLGDKVDGNTFRFSLDRQGVINSR